MKLTCRLVLATGLTILISVPQRFAVRADALPDLVAKVAPSVLSVAAAIKNKDGRSDISQGTGFVVDRVGKSVFVLTNAHVVEGASAMEVSFDAGRARSAAKLLGFDRSIDLALLEAVIPETMNADSVVKIPLARSETARIGERLFAIGNPFGLRASVTDGILSAKNRSIGVGRVDRYLQSNVAINFGNSGGPLFNMRGEVIGVNTLVRADAQGIAFSIPSETVERAWPLLRGGKAIREFSLGLYLVPATPTVQARFAPAVAKPMQGLFVWGVVAGGPAEKIGLKEGDLVSAYKDPKTEQFVELRDPNQLVQVLGQWTEGNKLELKVQRGTKQLLAQVVAMDRAQFGSVYDSY